MCVGEGMVGVWSVCGVCVEYVWSVWSEGVCGVCVGVITWTISTRIAFLITSVPTRVMT